MSESRVTTIESALETGKGLSCPVLAQDVWRLEPGSSRRGTGPATLFAFAGSGTLRTAGDEHAFRAETGAVVEDGFDVAAEAEPLVVLSVKTPPATATGKRVVHFGDVEPEPAGIGRFFRLLAQSSAATQFVGIIPSGRAKMHNHPYDELACVLEGDGILHWHEGPSVPVGRGSLIYFPRLVFHSLENTRGETLRIMGVFHPAGSPADRVEVLDY